MTDRAVIPQDRTAVPVEWDDFRNQLQKLDETAAADRAGRRQHAGRVRQHRRRQPARAGRQHPRHHHQALAGVLGARRSQQRHLHHVQEPVDAGVRAAGQRGPARAAQPEPGRRDSADGRRPERRSAARSRISSARHRRRHRASPTTTARRSAPRPDKLASVSRRWSTASTTSSRRCTSRRPRSRTSSTSTSRPTAR